MRHDCGVFNASTVPTAQRALEKPNFDLGANNVAARSARDAKLLDRRSRRGNVAGLVCVQP